ncbi:hypothetical protein COHA_010405 [Chlorella ohadii]|uniref:Uncharacterized protein n=1 Tax=Chlorella ohadii TaxID=2649997 RepID=A0AAD5DGB4_9CHLO|nr:hypothetical protein COHA_010405 [Chlorella ohadii]
MALACVTPCSALRPAAAASGSSRGAQQQQRAAAPTAQLLGWRRQRRRQRQAAVHASEEDLDQQLQADLERLRQRQAAAGGGGAPQAASPIRQQQQQAASTSSGGDSPLGGLKDAVDKVLIADFFFILFALAWLGAALAERSALQSTRLLDTWLSLWQWVFQPAIGVLMLGALVSGGVGWAKDNLGGGQR